MTSRTVRISTTDMNEVLTPTLAPGSSVRLPMNPSTGAVMSGVRQVDLQLVEPRPGLLHRGLRQIELRLGRLKTRIGVVHRLAGEQLPIVEALRSIQVVLSQLQRRLTLADRGLRDAIRRFLLLDLFLNFAVFDLGDRLALLDVVAELHEHVLEPSLRLRHGVNRGGADQVADHGDLVDHVAACH